jgi:hypothetical protein
LAGAPAHEQFIVDLEAETALAVIKCVLVLYVALCCKHNKNIQNIYLSKNDKK